MRRGKFTLCLIPMLFLAAEPSVAAEKKAAEDPRHESIKAAAALMATGKPAETIAAVEPILASYEAEFASEKRQIYCGMNSSETLLYMMEAASNKKDAVAVAPDWCEALFLKGFSLVDLKQYETGMPFLARAAAMAPGHAHYLNELGYAHQALRHWPESLAAYSRAADYANIADAEVRTTQQTRAWRGMGFALVEQGKWDEAAEMYRKCLKLDPNDAKAKGELQYIVQTKPRTS